LTEEDLSPESLNLQLVRPKALAALAFTRIRSPLVVSGLVSDFATAAVSDGLSRASAHFGLDAGTKLNPEGLQRQLLSWCLHHELEQVAVPYVPVGVVKDVLQPALSMLAERGLRIALIRRSWDELHWPYATHGYFRFKKNVLPGLSKRNAGAGPQARYTE
jgi:deoxyribodipyrimidine photo-lyase